MSKKLSSHFLFVGGQSDGMVRTVSLPNSSTLRVPKRLPLDEFITHFKNDPKEHVPFDLHSEEYILTPIHAEAKLPAWVYLHVDICPSEIIWSTFMAFTKVYAREALNAK